MDFSQMVAQHIETGAGVTVAAIRQPLSLANQFGVIEVDREDPRRISEFLEKPESPEGLPDSPDEVLASMGNYVFDASVLEEAVTADASDDSSKHDMGGDIVPAFVREGTGYVYDFKDNEIPGATDRDRGYWRDVGTLDSYFDAHMDLVSIHPVFNLYNTEWPIYTNYGSPPPAKFVHGSQDRVGQAVNSAVSPGSVVSGASISGSVLSPLVHVHSFSAVSESVLLDGVNIGRSCQIHRAIIDKGVDVPPGVSIGVDHDEDRERGFTVTDSGLVVIGKGTVIEG
jgi:glucose-1-phosphate adenylyltransferase